MVKPNTANTEAEKRACFGADNIVIRGAREHNLKNVDVEIPRGKITVITGLSGSGKSTLAFDTLYAEGQRRYVESLSAYARQFLGMMNPPDVDSIEGLSPAISIDQKTTSRNPRSTVGTVTEIYDYLRLLYARVGKPHCPECGKPISTQGAQAIAATLISSWPNLETELFYPLAHGVKGGFEKELAKLKALGFYTVYLDGNKEDLSESVPKPDKNRKHSILVFVDKVVCSSEEKTRLVEAIESALASNGVLIARNPQGEEKVLSSKNACPEHGTSFGEIQPRDFSFNSPFGACQECHGLGFKMEFSPDLIILDSSLSIKQGAITCYGRLMEGGWRAQQLMAVAREHGIRTNVPVSEISKKQLDLLLYGSEKKIRFTYESKKSGSAYEYENKFEGVIPQLERLYYQTESESRKEEIGKFMREKTCPSCLGKRLKKEMLSVLIAGSSIDDVCRLPISRARVFLAEAKFAEGEKLVAMPIIKEIGSRLEFLENVGLHYLNLARQSSTLSGGESQRIRLATQIGSNLTGILYVLDEPSIGLHQRDNAKLLATLEKLRNLGNTLVVVEHDEETMRECDYLIDMGPFAGVHGGRIVARGTVEDIMREKTSLTGDYLSGRKSIAIPSKRRKHGEFLAIEGASENNLKKITAAFPLGLLTCVTGVSGSGKSTLVSETLYPALSNKLNNSKLPCGAHKKIMGFGALERIIVVDQSPIGRTPRSNPATYVGAFTLIRELFSKTVEARSRGYAPGRFSFNVDGGRCPSCKGDGLIKVSMHFLADVYVPCENCKGKRYNPQTLEIRYKERNIAEVLEMSASQALEFFENVPAIRNKLQTISDIGLGYIKLGQPATTLSGGEAQRVKLATELSKRSEGKTMYLLDEPTTGLHFEDVNQLLSILQRLVEKKNTVVIIEHNLDVIKNADWVIDLGPEGGENGGQVIAFGTPEQVASRPGHTGAYLKEKLDETFREA
ncbi:excinuclease ABC subunit A [Candidatus Micrarchaeota archaeon CG1_02_51_15]|nr:MAG: excinuclease ABC subunit A [Candidatus Micrarchaeota archaeon CG1_02_51_15]